MRNDIPWTIGLLTAILVLAVAVADYATGTEILVLPLYFVPLLLAAWYFPRRWAMFVAVIVTFAWINAQYFGGLEYSSAEIWAVNLVTQGILFLVITALISAVRNNLRTRRETASTDQLTGLPNRRSFFDRAGSVLAVCYRNNQPATLAYLDLDNFKQANEKLGHREGDKLLKKVADILGENLRSSDIAARFGNDEFILLLPETTEDNALIALEKVRARLARTEEFVTGDVTASIGAVTSTPAPSDISRLLKAADRIMHRVKADGRNRVLVEGVEPA